MSSINSLLVLLLLISLLKTVQLKVYHCDTNDVSFSKPLSQRLWPKATISYEFHSNFTAAAITLITRAIGEFEVKTCIRFRPRAKRDEDYIRFNLSTRVCGQADVGREGGPQYVLFKAGCITFNTAVHQLGHTLGLRHEHQRIDRNMYLSFERCKIVDIPPMNVYSSLNHLFDFNSQMAFPCNSCLGGYPKVEGLHGCGSTVTTGLSVIDVDRLNELYECDGPCFAHRWKRHTQLNAKAVKEAFPFGFVGESSTPYYLCRGYVKGEISPGKYRLDRKTCYVAHDDKEVKLRGVDVQILVIPNMKNVSRNGHLSNPIPVGRSATGVTIYAALAELNWKGGEQMELSIGKVYDDNKNMAFFTFERRVVVKVEEDFETIACKNIADGPKEIRNRYKKDTILKS